MNYAFVLMHGWGANGDYWQNLVDHLGSNDCFIYEQGYFLSSGDFTSSNEVLKDFIDNHQDDKIIGVGHSIGFIKLLEMDVKFDYVFGLQSFINFLGSNPSLEVVEKSFDDFVSKFVENPAQGLKDKYISSGIYKYFDESLFREDNINNDLLMRDLESLREDKSHLLHKLPEGNYHIFGTSDDVIVPSFIIKDNFPEDKMEIFDLKCGHSLGILHGKFIAGEIFKRLVEDGI